MSDYHFHLIGEEDSPLIVAPLKGHKEGSIITLVVPPDKLASVTHKIRRINQQEVFAKSHQARFDALTNRERQILVLLSMGLNNPKIAEDLFISRKTVEQHRKNINRKLEIRSFADVVRYALAFDLI